MQYFLETSDTIPEGLGFPQFGLLHAAELAIFLCLAAGLCLFYRKCGEGGRRNVRIWIAVLLVLDEIFKHVMLIIGGNWLPDYLPLHLCSINIFLIAVHAGKPKRSMASFLYCICLPGALAALLFPAWNKLPVANFMHLHSWSVHMLLAVYPLILLVGGEVDRNPRQIPKCLLILVGLAAVAYGANLLFDANFMFLMYAPDNNPLRYFEAWFGNHLIGFPVIIAVVWTVMYLPLPKRKCR